LLYHYFLKAAAKREEGTRSNKRPRFWGRMLQAVGDRMVFLPLRANLGLHRCKTAVTTGSPISADCFRFWTSLGLGLKEVYISTEAGFISAHRSGEVLSGSVGHIPRGTSVKICGEGEILVKSLTVFSGYYGSPEKTGETLKDGWVQTGDAGFIGPQGQLVLCDERPASRSQGASLNRIYMEGRLRFSPYIKDALIVEGKEGDFLAVIVVLDFENLGKWAEDNQIKYMNFAELSQKEETARLIRVEIQQINREIPVEGRIKKFALLQKEFHADEGELTRTGKLKRKFLEERYSSLIGAFYAPREGLGIKTPVHYRDGRDGTMKMDIQIWPTDQDAL
ncbi:MAG TPA: long-chain fatty acid--CoA ligase, partial [Thermodesulfobacteriota bacterium]|nr:long-chain fatty acid--CoA ligase [Thermodesulfobacteriota bacterium]